MTLIKHKQKGMTLLEIMLVIAIAALIIVGSIRLNTARQNDLQVSELKQQVDELFNAMNLYWRSHCEDSYTDAVPPTITAGPLTGINLILFNISADLGAFLPGGWASRARNNSLIDPTAAGTDSGFLATIFNQASPFAVGAPLRRLCSSVAAAGPTRGQCNGFTEEVDRDANNGVTMPVMQIAIKAKETNPERLQALVNRLEAICLSSPQNITTPNAATIGNKSIFVGTCSTLRTTPATTDRFIVFEKTVSPAPTASTYWPMIHQLTTFKNMYNHDMFYEYQTGTTTEYRCGI